jgi:hypothetical protein
VYFQAAKEATPIQSGVDIFGSAFSIAPFAIINGISVLLLNRYRPQNYLGWILGLIGMGLFSNVTADTSRARNIGYQIIEGAGLGMLFTATTFPVLAPVKVSEAANALAFFTFVRAFAQVGVPFAYPHVLKLTSLARFVDLGYLDRLHDLAEWVETAALIRFPRSFPTGSRRRVCDHPTDLEAAGASTIPSARRIRRQFGSHLEDNDWHFWCRTVDCIGDARIADAYDHGRKLWV